MQKAPALLNYAWLCIQRILRFICKGFTCQSTLGRKGRLSSKQIQSNKERDFHQLTEKVSLFFSSSSFSLFPHPVFSSALGLRGQEQQLGLMSADAYMGKRGTGGMRVTLGHRWHVGHTGAPGHRQCGGHAGASTACGSHLHTGAPMACWSHTCAPRCHHPTQSRPGEVMQSQPRWVPQS